MLLARISLNVDCTGRLLSVVCLQLKLRPYNIFKTILNPFHPVPTFDITYYLTTFPYNFIYFIILSSTHTQKENTHNIVGRRNSEQTTREERPSRLRANYDVSQARVREQKSCLWKIKAEQIKKWNIYYTLWIREEGAIRIDQLNFCSYKH